MWELSCLFKLCTSPQIITILGNLKNYCAKKIKNIIYLMQIIYQYNIYACTGDRLSGGISKLED